MNRNELTRYVGAQAIFVIFQKRNDLAAYL